MDLLILELLEILWKQVSSDLCSTEAHTFYLLKPVKSMLITLKLSSTM